MLDQLQQYVPVGEVHTNLPTGTFFVYCIIKFKKVLMNYNDFWDNVLNQEEWNDELKRWENTHPEYKPFKEDSDSQRQQNLSN